MIRVEGEKDGKVGNVAHGIGKHKKRKTNTVTLSLHLNLYLSLSILPRVKGEPGRRATERR